MNESGLGTPIVLRHQFKDLENHKNSPKDVTSLEWNVSVSLLDCVDYTGACWPEVSITQAY